MIIHIPFTNCYVGMTSNNFDQYENGNGVVIIIFFHTIFKMLILAEKKKSMSTGLTLRARQSSNLFENFMRYLSVRSCFLFIIDG